MKRHSPASLLRSRPLVAGWLFVLGALILRLFFREPARVLDASELAAFNESAGLALGRFLAERHPGGRVLIVVRPGAEDGRGTQEEKSLLEGFQKAVAGRLQIAAVVAPRVPDRFREDVREKVARGEIPERDTGLMLAATTIWYDMRVLAELIRSQPEPVSLLVTTMALPADFPGGPDLAASLPPAALLLAPVLDLARMLDSGKVEAMVVFQPPKDWTTVDSPGADAGKTFDSRYFLLHAGNRDEMQRRYPGAFR